MDFTCAGKTKKGDPCKRKVASEGEFCKQHRSQGHRAAMDWYEQQCIQKMGKEKWERLKALTNDL